MRLVAATDVMGKGKRKGYPELVCGTKDKEKANTGIYGPDDLRTMIRFLESVIGKLKAKIEHLEATGEPLVQEGRGADLGAFNRISRFACYALHGKRPRASDSE